MKNKKILRMLPVALLAVFGLLMTGCPESFVEPGPPPSFSVDLVALLGTAGSYAFPFVENPYPQVANQGFQSKIINDKLFDGRKVMKGGRYYLKYSFTPSRASAQKTYVGIVDGTEETGGWWLPLTWSGGDDMAVIADTLTAGTVVTGTARFTGFRTAAGPAKEQNQLVIQNDSEAFSLGTNTLTFTVLEFGRE